MVSNHTQGKIQTHSHGHKMWLPPTTDVTSYHSTPLPYNYPPAQGQPTCCPLLFSHPSSAYIKALSFCLNTPPQIPSLHSDLCTKFLPLSHTEVFSEEKKRLSKTAPQPIFVFSPTALITTWNDLFIYLIHKTTFSEHPSVCAQCALLRAGDTVVNEISEDLHPHGAHTLDCHPMEVWWSQGGLGSTNSPAPRSAPWYRVGINIYLLNGKNVPLPWDQLPLGGLPPQSSSCLPGGYRTQNAHCVPLETAIPTVSLPFLSWVSNLGLLVLTALSSRSNPQSPASSPGGHAIALSPWVIKAPGPHGGSWPSSQHQSSQLFSTKSSCSQNAWVILPPWLMVVVPCNSSHETFNISYLACLQESHLSIGHTVVKYIFCHFQLP